MPVDFTDLYRGAICRALFPYSLGFPATAVLREAEDEARAQLAKYGSVDEVAVEVKQGREVHFAIRFKLRPVLLLQDGASRNRSRNDISVVPVVSVKADRVERKPEWYRGLHDRTHLAHYLVGTEPRHGLGNEECYADLMDVRTIPKAAVFEHLGSLDDEEMRAISGRLIHTLQIDISHLT